MYLKSVETIRMNEIFLYLALLRSKASFFCLEIETKINTSSVKGSGEDEIGTIIIESDICDAF